MAYRKGACTACGRRSWVGHRGSRGPNIALVGVGEDSGRYSVGGRGDDCGSTVYSRLDGRHGLWVTGLVDCYPEVGCVWCSGLESRHGGYDAEKEQPRCCRRVHGG